MRALILYILISASAVLFLSVLSMADEEGYSVEEHLKLERKHNIQDNPTNIWRFQISTPRDGDVYPPAYFWFSARPYMDSTLPPVYGNQIYLRKDIED